jgi:hypothetical protein
MAANCFSLVHVDDSVRHHFKFIAVPLFDIPFVFRVHIAADYNPFTFSPPFFEFRQVAGALNSWVRLCFTLTERTQPTKV